MLSQKSFVEKKRKTQWEPCTKYDVINFVKATGGGKGKLVSADTEQIEGGIQNTVFSQSEPARSEDLHPKFPKPRPEGRDLSDEDLKTDKKAYALRYGVLGFGRIQFPENVYPARYLRVPWKISLQDAGILSTHPQALLYFVENVWNLPRPRLLISVTGGAMDFPMNVEKEKVLYQLMSTARRTNAWLVTGGSRAGIMKYVGEARKSFGGNIPLIGIATWGIVNQNEELVVEEGSRNYGYVTRHPVRYEPKGNKAKLDPNHSHFILVDDGSDGAFGREIDLRGQFEACACMHKGNPEEQLVANTLIHEGIGWEGCLDGWTAAYRDRETEAGELEASLAVCFCFEGGPGTIATVSAATKNRTPVLLMQGSGRAADLISDCVRVFESTDEVEDEGVTIVKSTDEDPFNKERIRRSLMIRRFSIFMSEIKDASLCNMAGHEGARITWPPRIVNTAEQVDIGDWRHWKRQWQNFTTPSNSLDGEGGSGGGGPAGGPVWVKGEWVNGVLKVDGSAERAATLKPGSDAHLKCAAAIGRKLFKEYNLAFADNVPDDRVLSMMCDLYDTISSRLCLVYDLDARVVVDGKREQLDVLEYTVNAITLGIQAEAARRKAGIVLFLWHKVAKMKVRWSSFKMDAGDAAAQAAAVSAATRIPKKFSATTGTRGLGGTKVWSSSKKGMLDLEKEKEKSIREIMQEEANANTNNKALLDIERNAQSLWLHLLIEWDKKDVVHKLLQTLDSHSLFTKKSLNRALRVALKHDRCEIARVLLSHGADLELYANYAAGGAHGDRAVVWKELLLAASTQAEEKYLQVLVQQGRVDNSALSLLISSNMTTGDMPDAPMLSALDAAFSSSFTLPRSLSQRSILLRAASDGRLLPGAGSKGNKDSGGGGGVSVGKNLRAKLRTVANALATIKHITQAVITRRDRSDGESALSVLRASLSRSAQLRGKFDPREILDDRQTKAILNRIYTIIVDPRDMVLLSHGHGGGSRGAHGGGGGGGAVAPRHEEMSSLDAHFNFNTNPDFDLFLCMVLVNRPELAKLFYLRDGRERAAFMMPAALLACLLCRNLRKHPAVDLHFHLKTAFEHMADEYESFAARILRTAYDQNVERTLSALEWPVEQCGHWRCLDLLVLGQCTQVVEACPELCTEAVQRRFRGKGGVSAAMMRLNQCCVEEISQFLRARRGGYLVIEARDKEQKKTQMRKKLSDAGMFVEVVEVVKSKHPGLDFWTRLVLCLMIDSVGIVQFVTAVLPLPVHFLWAAFSAFCAHQMYGQYMITGLTMVEELVWLIIPTNTVCCLWQRSTDLALTGNRHAHAADGGEDDESVDYLPIDYFISDALAHALLTYLLTLFVLMHHGSSAVESAIEILIFLLYILDEIPDILFAGVDRESETVVQILRSGFREYIAVMG